MPNAFAFREETAKGILSMYHSYKRQGERVILPEPLPGGVRYWEGTLQGNLEPATDRLNDFSTANFKFLTLDPDNAGKAHLKQTELQEECINRDKFAVYFEGEYVAGIIRFGRYEVLWPGRRAMYGQADSDIAAESTGTVSLYEGATDSTLDLTSVFNITDQQATTGNRVEVTPDEGGDRWVLKPLECPA